MGKNVQYIAKSIFRNNHSKHYRSVKQGLLVEQFLSSFIKFYCRHHDFVYLRNICIIGCITFDSLS